MDISGESSDIVTHRGGCHCGAVRFEVEAPAVLPVVVCNCSVCRMTGFLHLIVTADNFSLISGEDALTDYRFNTGIAKHLFCKTCGVKSFYVPRSHPDGYSVNVNCFVPDTIMGTEETQFDGQNWEDNIAAITADAKGDTK